MKRQRAAIKADVAQRKAKVRRIWDNGDCVLVEFTRNDGEVVIGKYEFAEWDRAPGDPSNKFRSPVTGESLEDTNQLRLIEKEES